MYLRSQRDLGEHLDQSHTSNQAKSYYSCFSDESFVSGRIIDVPDKASNVLTTQHFLAIVQASSACVNFLTF